VTVDIEDVSFKGKKRNVTLEEEQPVELIPEGDPRRTHAQRT
jgi:hypothetical protein